MIVSPVNNTNYPQKHISTQNFTSQYGIQKMKLPGCVVEEPLRPHFTTFLRFDFPWEKFVKLLDRKYQNTEKVNVYSLGCSDGSEPYSLSMMLTKLLGEKKAQKFFPIIAVDNNSKLTAIGESGKIPLLPEFHGLLEYLNMKFRYGNTKNLFKHNHNFKKPEIEISENIKKTVKFVNADIINFLDKIENKNSSVLCRNIWPYLNNEQITRLADKLGKLDKSSLCAIGEFDLETSTIKNLRKRGYNYSDFDLCFEKPDRIR